MTVYLRGGWGGEEAARRLRRDPRHFAKRQLTWFRSDPALTWLTITEQDSAGPVAQRILDHLSRAGIRCAKIGRAQSELQSLAYLVCRLLLEKKKKSDYHLHTCACCRFAHIDRA